MKLIGNQFNPNISYMVQNIHYDILVAITERIADELYDVVIHRPEMMVCDWRAYAILEAYRQYADIIDPIPIPDIDECFSGEATPGELYLNNIWLALTDLHEFHWERSRDENLKSVYDEYLNIPALVLEHYTLTI